MRKIKEYLLAFSYKTGKVWHPPDWSGPSLAAIQGPIGNSGRFLCGNLHFIQEASFGSGEAW